VPPYSDWSEAFPQLGTMGADGTYYVTTAGSVGTNLVAITDSAGNLVEADVYHLRSLPPLEIIPETTSLPDDGDRAVYIANGGLPGYTWSLAYPARGQIIGSVTGSSITYQRLNEGNQIIVVEDSDDNFAQVTVTQESPLPPVIVPSTVTLSSNETSYAFSVEQGTPNYVWSVITANGGTVNPNNGTAVVYTADPAGRPGSHVIRVIDGNNQTALATVILE
jgi:hypothetical protein